MKRAAKWLIGAALAAGAGVIGHAYFQLEGLS